MAGLPTRNTSVPAHHMASDGAAELKITRSPDPFSRVEMASVSSATVTVAASGPYTNRAAKLKASPIEKLAVTDRIRSTVRPLTIAAPAGISHARLMGDFTRLIRESTMHAVPRTLTPQRYAAGLFM